MSLTWLSGDTVVLVLSNLSALETCRLMRVSTPLREVCSRDGVWKQLSHKAHPHPHSKAGPRRSYGFRLQFKKAARRVWEREWRRARQELAMIELPLSSQMQALNAATQALELAEQSVDKADWLGERVQGWVPRGVETTRHGIQALKAKRDDAKKHMVRPTMVGSTEVFGWCRSRSRASWRRGSRGEMPCSERWTVCFRN
eukprot:TRINITY_DN11280_c0_g1_i1.p1 TRINITY_DN11280_c0_g1~~TRINITY_DN11280_c0_g1_i1.p1  ORF type:complete len:200 (+),score=38.78 TRINITY_DN11280_c0_g1_i1:269-868(+)